MLALALIVCLITVPLAGGRLSALADVQLRRPWLAAAGIALQVVVLAIAPGAVGELGAPLHGASYALLGAFAWSNRRLAGVPLIAFGGALNALVIVVNGGVMPADPDAIARAGRTVREGGEFSNSAPATDPTLGFLGDVIATPAWWPMPNVYSAGDVLLVLGALWFLHAACGSRLVPSSARRALASGTAAR